MTLYKKDYLFVLEVLGMEKKENESEYEPITVSIPKSVIKRIDDFSKKQDIPPYRSHIFVKALEEFLEKRGN
jgi:hypothetical protein